MTITVNSGDALVSYINLTDAAGDGVAGATFTTIIARTPDNGVFTVSTVELGNGVYQVTGSGQSIPGEYYALVEANDAYQSRFSETWDVVGVQPVAATVPANTGITRSELRRLVARELGDLVTVTATANGSQSSIIAGVDLAREQGAFAGMQIYCTGGSPTNVGQIATVTGSDYAMRTLSFAPPFPVATQLGDAFDLYNRRGTGFLFNAYNEAINTAITKAGEQHAALPYSLTPALPFSRTAATLVIPEPFSHFTRIDYVQRDGSRRAIPPKFVDVDRSTREVTIRGQAAHDMNGRAYRLVGAARPPKLYDDNDRTQISADWIITEVVAILFGGDAAQGVTQGARDRLYVMNRQGADGRRPTVVTTFGPNTIRLD